jgi:acyl-CoA thioesterase FadM
MNNQIQQSRSYSFTIGSNDVNENGIYTSCSLLQEMTRANDLTNMAAFATTNIAAIHATHYSVDFLSQVVKGDTLRIETNFTMDAKRHLYVQVRVSKLVKRMQIAVSTGNFTFIDTNTKKVKTLHADTVLA